MKKKNYQFKKLFNKKIRKFKEQVFLKPGVMI